MWSLWPERWHRQGVRFLDTVDIVIGLIGIAALVIFSLSLGYWQFVIPAILLLVVWPLARKRLFLSWINRGWKRFALRHGLQPAPLTFQEAPTWFMNGQWKERALRISVRPYKKVETAKDDLGRPIYYHLMLSELALGTTLQKQGSIIPFAGGDHLADFVPPGNPRRRKALTGEPDVDAGLQEAFLVFGFEGLADENILSLRHAKTLLEGFGGHWPDRVVLRRPAVALTTGKMSLLLLGEIYRPATLQKLLAFLHDLCCEMENRYLID